MPHASLSLRQVIGYLGRDHVVHALLTFGVAGHTFTLARAEDAGQVLWVEPPRHPADERWPILTEVTDLDMATPPPQQIDYGGSIYVLRFGGPASVEVSGRAAGRTSGALRLWRYRAAGDRHLQIEEWPSGRVVILAGEAVHRGMLEIWPAPGVG